VKKKAAVPTSTNNNDLTSGPAVPSSSTATVAGGGASIIPAPTAATNHNVTFASPEPSPLVQLKQEVFRNKVHGHRVKSLQKELKKRALPTGGLKKNLQERLVEVYVEEEQKKKLLQQTQQNKKETQQNVVSMEPDEPNVETASSVASSNKPKMDDQKEDETPSDEANSVICLLDSSCDSSMEVDDGQKPVIKQESDAFQETDWDATLLDGGCRKQEEKSSESSLGADTTTDAVTQSDTLCQSPSPKHKAASQPKVDGSGRKRVRSPIRLVQSAFRKLSAASRSPVHKKLATSTSAAHSTASSLGQQQPLLNSDTTKVLKGTDEMDAQDALLWRSEGVRDDLASKIDSWTHPTKHGSVEQEDGEPPLSSSKGPVRLVAPPFSAVRATGAAAKTTPWSSQDRQTRVKQMSEKAKASDAARRARIAEIRGKVHTEQRFAPRLV